MCVLAFLVSKVVVSNKKVKLEREREIGEVCVRERETHSFLPRKEKFNNFLDNIVLSSPHPRYHPPTYIQNKQPGKKK